METKIRTVFKACKTSPSLAVVIPSGIIKEMGIKEGDKVMFARHSDGFVCLPIKEEDIDASI